MDTYQKINAPFKRYTEGALKGKFIEGQWSLPEFEYLQHNEWEFTEKVDGTNIRIGWGPWANTNSAAWAGIDARDSAWVDFAGRSDNAVIPVPLLEYLHQTFVPQRFLDAGLNGVVLHGEGYGPKIQNGGNYRSDVSFVLFDVQVIDVERQKSWWLRRADIDDVAQKLGIDSVPTVGVGTLTDAFEIIREGHKSQWGDFLAEGVVATPVVPLYARDGSRIITKVKTVDFKK